MANWNENNNFLIKEFTLKSFSEITKMLPEIAEVADKMNHHPNFEVSQYNHIKFKLQTHSENKVTKLDHQLAEKIDQIISSYN